MGVPLVSAVVAGAGALALVFRSLVGACVWVVVAVVGPLTLVLRELLAVVMVFGAEPGPSASVGFCDKSGASRRDLSDLYPDGRQKGQNRSMRLRGLLVLGRQPIEQRPRRSLPP
ncbi:MAG TPA: hypothetical protein VL738_23515 [Dactylosporangium sp.]|nr:hypothetical protein [Dactylosporangium sp.]